MEKIHKTKRFHFQDIHDQEILYSIAKIIPSKTRVYLYGGAVRNALYFQLFGKRLPQRDYDLVVIGDYKQFIQNLKSIGFVVGKKSRVVQKLTLKKAKIKTPQQYGDYLWLDMVLRDKEQIRGLLTKRVNFTINGFALPLNNAFKNDWQRRIIALPHAFTDLKRRQLRTWVIHPIDIYAVIRFIFLGFKPPMRSELNKLLIQLRDIERWRFNRDTKKVISYVGSKKKVLKIAQKLGINIDIFNFKEIKSSTI